MSDFKGKFILQLIIDTLVLGILFTLQMFLPRELPSF